MLLLQRHHLLRDLPRPLPPLLDPPRIIIAAHLYVPQRLARLLQRAAQALKRRALRRAVRVDRGDLAPQVLVALRPRPESVQAAALREERVQPRARLVQPPLLLRLERALRLPFWEQRVEVGLACGDSGEGGVELGLQRFAPPACAVGGEAQVGDGALEFRSCADEVGEFGLRAGAGECECCQGGPNLRYPLLQALVEAHI